MSPEEVPQVRIKNIVYNLKGIVAESAKIDEVNPLIATIKTTIKPEHWDLMGGKGAISAFIPSPDNWWRLIIRCEEDVHAEVEKLLDDLKAPS
ncbi:hypothetical protein V6x_51590 [Gimesia chilikensis]|uniref:Uncharacterized protein n=1 Tax=Gimesia chilikensis TaxID=2605989 RepID=A0A517WJI7_9PLAN|nr:hypothetical protein [Gimesia chilikensis]KAA0134435.1 hypothetical protein FYZ48_20290 [Gimesia chilikensis]QDU05422.1 hypothetical protein V6x_51590 [Gimesia chilikensis]